MISKERLLAGLHEAVYVEEGIVTMLTKFSQGLISENPASAGDKKQDINKLLSKLHQDSYKHKERIEALIRKIEKEDKNEY